MFIINFLIREKKQLRMAENFKFTKTIILTIFILLTILKYK